VEVGTISSVHDPMGFVRGFALDRAQHLVLEL